ncbi:MAG: biotin--[acetyl-CoA-carboxylase] ligase [Candidatus Wallbacteria bacterium]|nr:biotin--[acetyl-CoA-carboxylase] ligase [Candidatus Wallbacteria bacterium]
MTDAAASGKQPGELGPRRADLEGAFEREARSRWLGRSLVWLQRCDSTNDVAKLLAAARWPSGTIVAADEQTRGRGRKGDPWHSPAGGGLWSTFLFYPQVDASLAPRATALMAGALIECLRAHLGIECVMKPPNDVLLGGRKLAGILAESATVGNSRRLEFLAIGIGVNVSTRFPEGLRDIATSLAEHVAPGAVPTVPAMLAWLAAELECRWEAFDRRET